MPRDYLKDNLSPVHARFLFLYDQLPDKFYQCALDNLYMSAKFSNLALKINIYVSRVTRKGGRGIPSSLLQEEFKSRQAQIVVFGTVKAEILCGEHECNNLLDVSVYDTKPVLFLNYI